MVPSRYSAFFSISRKFIFTYLVLMAQTSLVSAQEISDETLKMTDKKSLLIEVFCKDNDRCLFTGEDIFIDVKITNVSKKQIGFPVELHKKKGPSVRIKCLSTNSETYLRTLPPDFSLKEKFYSIQSRESVTIPWVIHAGELTQFGIPVDLSVKVSIAGKIQVNGKTIDFEGGDDFQIVSQPNHNPMDSYKINNQAVTREAFDKFKSQLIVPKHPKQEGTRTADEDYGIMRLYEVTMKGTGEKYVYIYETLRDVAYHRIEFSTAQPDFDWAWKSTPKSFKKKISEVKVGDTLEKLIELVGEPDAKEKSRLVYTSSGWSGYLCTYDFDIIDGVVVRIVDRGCAHVSIQ